MKSLVATVVALGTLAAPIAVPAGQPPIIDRSLFFGEITIDGAQISPDGRYISFLNRSGVRATFGSKRRTSRSARLAR